MTKDKSDLLLRMVQMINTVVDKPGGLAAKEVADILSGLGDMELQRSILAQFMMAACSKGNVSEVVAWAVVLSHVEGKLPALDVQLEAKHLMTEH